MDSNEAIKEAFQKAKQDISELRSQVLDLSNQIQDLKSLITSIYSQNKSPDRQTNQQTNSFSPTFPQQNPTIDVEETTRLPSKIPNSEISTGNRGVPTDRQTNQQTDRQTFSPDKSIGERMESNNQVRLIEVSKALDSLDSLKQYLKKQFSHLTKQEMLFFSTVYQLDEEGFAVDYSLLASKLHLSESSIRDYSLKIIRKGLPLIKTKHQNKKTFLSISPDLKKIASLQAILSLKKL